MKRAALLAVILVLSATLALPAVASLGRLWTGSSSSGVWETSPGKPGNGPRVGTVVESSGYETHHLRSHHDTPSRVT
jgi:hypothetical protein